MAITISNAQGEESLDMRSCNNIHVNNQKLLTRQHQSEQEQQQQERSHRRTRHLQYCGACALCGDSCGDFRCVECDCAFTSFHCPRDCTRYYTMCEIQRHNTERSAWLVAGGEIYDVTEYIHQHPGGKQSILKKTGGAVDCTKDLLFHSKKGRKLWKTYRIGKVKRCPSETTNCVGSIVEKEWWKFWD